LHFHCTLPLVEPEVTSCKPDHMLYLYSEAHMLAIRLSPAIEKRLTRLARRTGRTKSFYVREAILQHLEDLEDIYLAERTLQRIQDGEERTIPLEEVLKRHGLED
jgi:RHH-type rel operon transcriptional repressor/antitoxin RelB